MLVLVKPVSVSYFKADKWWSDDLSRTLMEKRVLPDGPLLYKAFNRTKKGIAGKRSKRRRRLSPRLLSRSLAMEELTALLALSRVDKIGNVRKKRLVEGHESIASLFEGREKAENAADDNGDTRLSRQFSDD